MGIEVGEQATRSSAANDVALADPGFTEFAVAGSEGAGEFGCADCGYGVVVQRVLPVCPMCGGSVWESRGPLAPR